MFVRYARCNISRKRATTPVEREGKTAREGKSEMARKFAEQVRARTR